MYDLFKDYLPAINHTKKNLMNSDDPMWEKKYPAFMVNKVLSGFQDTIILFYTLNVFNLTSSQKRSKPFPLSNTI